jgi:hypothetical protein
VYKNTVKRVSPKAQTNMFGSGWDVGNGIKSTSGEYDWKAIRKIREGS